MVIRLPIPSLILDTIRNIFVYRTDLVGNDDFENLTQSEQRVDDFELLQNDKKFQVESKFAYQCLGVIF